MRRPLLLAALALAWLTVGPLGVPAPVPAAAQSAASSSEVVVTGHGYGHGRGLGQYGSYGYAKDDGWTWQQITDHFYGGTTLGTAPNDELDVLLKGYGTGWTTAILEVGTITTSLDAQLTGGPNASRRSVAVEWLGGDSWRLYEGDSCTGMAGGPFVDRGTFSATQVVIATADPAPDDRTELLGACEFTGTTPRGHRYVRGVLVADSFATATDPSVGQRTMNRVAVEDYLRSVVPAESPSSWGGDGTAPGMHALRSQAVAARSYALAGDSRWGTAETCDDVFCQVYRGFGYNAAGTVSLFESSNGDLAVAQTAGQVRRTSGGGVARTEFSSSTGGYTAGGAFPAVVDDGDDVSANPNHDWTPARLPVGDIETILDAHAGRDLGVFEQFVVTDRNGLGADGGRVREVVAEFAGGDLELTGNQFRSLFQKFGVKSDWFVTPPPTQAGSFSDTAGNAHEANIDKIAEAGIATGFPDGTFRPNESVSRGQMATFLTKGYELPAASSPTFSDIAGDTHEADIRAVAAAEIASGYPDGTYRPANPVTRGQMAAFLARAEDLTLADEGSNLCDTDGHLFEREIRAVITAGIASGHTDGCFHPDDPVTRGQMATFLARALGL
jgi:hypothetical protein